MTAGRFRLGPFYPREDWLTAQIAGQSSGVTRVDLTADSIDAGDFVLAESEYTSVAEN